MPLLSFFSPSFVGRASVSHLDTWSIINVFYGASCYSDDSVSLQSHCLFFLALSLRCSEACVVVGE